VSLVASIAFFIIALAVGAPLTRLMAPGVAIFVLAAGALARRRGHVQLASASVLVSVLGAASIGMMLNSGLRAPIAVFMVFVVAACTWSFGKRWATAVAVAVTVFGVIVYFLGRGQLLPSAGPAPLEIELAVYVLSIWLIWSASVIPYHRMTEASVQAAERHRALLAEQERRREADLAFKAVLDQSHHCLLLVEPDGRVQTANRSAIAFMQLGSEAEIVGCALLESAWCPPESRVAMGEGLTQATTTRQTARFQSVISVLGKKHNIAHSVTPFIDPSGKLKLLIIEARDVTEIVEAQERKSKTHRLELVGQLAGGVAHDFNNVLLAILASGELLHLELNDQLTPDQRDYLGTITASARRAGDLTKRLLEVGRRTSLDKRPLSVHEIIGSALKLLERTLPANIKLELKLTATADLVKADAAALESAVLNLAVNARDAMAAGGTLTLSTQNVVIDEAWCQSSGFDLVPGAYLRLSVRDTGVGIAPELQSKVFEPFFTTKPEGRGTGLGLASVFGVVTDHRASIHLASEPGVGTVFHLRLPLAPGAELRPSPTGLGTALLAGKHVLLVDDERGVRAMVSRLFERAGATCTVAADAQQGLIAFNKAPTSFDYAVLDVVLPDRRGTELAADLLLLSPTLKILLVSGFPKDAEVDALPAARVQMLGKPFNFDTLQGMLLAMK